MMSRCMSTRFDCINGKTINITVKGHIVEVSEHVVRHGRSNKARVVYLVRRWDRQGVVRRGKPRGGNAPSRRRVVGWRSRRPSERRGWRSVLKL